MVLTLLVHVRITIGRVRVRVARIIRPVLALHHHDVHSAFRFIGGMVVLFLPIGERLSKLCNPVAKHWLYLCGMMRENRLKVWLIIASAVMLCVGMIMSAARVGVFGVTGVRLAWYIVAFLLVGWGVMREVARAMVSGHDFFTEFTLMTIASVGAFFIGEYAEAVAVMLLYCIGELLQDNAVDRARDNIKSLVAMRPDKVSVVNGDAMCVKRPDDVAVGDIMEVKPGERVALDGVLVSGEAEFNTSALTGESVPRLVVNGGEVLSGMIVSDSVARVKVSRLAGESTMARILSMVQDATTRKSPTELFIRRFSHVYTPIVIFLAALVVLLPWLYSLTDNTFTYVLGEWVRRALVLLVISCPCALVISVPLSYFGGIGAASRRGILFKGGNYLDATARLDTVVFDKTGTLTTGEFSVQLVTGLTQGDINFVAGMERKSNHPVARAIVRYATNATSDLPTANIKDIAGYGLSCDGWLVGTSRLLDRESVAYPIELKTMSETIVLVARDGVFKGYIVLADTLKGDSRQAVDSLKAWGISHIEVLSGDKQPLVDNVAAILGIDEAHGDLLPQGKVECVERLKSHGRRVAFVGDGINDAPVLALSDVGMAMGSIGSDMAVETADVVIQSDKPSKVEEAIGISRRTRRIVRQNISLAIGVKVAVMVLGLLGVVNLWEAVFADSGVALLAVLNATRVFIRP